MTTLKQGDLIKDDNGDICKVLGVCGEAVHLSHWNNHNHYGYTVTEAQLKENGYTWDTPAWEPEVDKMYWYIDEYAKADDSIWADDEADHDRKGLLGVYQTKELADAAVLEIRRKLQ